MKLEIVTYPDPFLRQTARDVEEIDDTLVELVEAMFLLMRRDKGIGLAAPQVRHSIKLFVINLSGDPKEHPEQNQVFINPVLTPVGTEKTWDEEGCLSFKDIRVEVERFARVRLVAFNLDGEEVSLDTAEDVWLARVLQHEYDHLLGRVLIDRSTSMSLAAAERSLRYLETCYKEKQVKSRKE